MKITISNNFRYKHYTSDQKKIAQEIFFASPKLYKIIRKKIPNLPTIGLVKQWRSFNYLEAGPIQKLTLNLKSIVGSMNSLEKKCIMLWDEVSIKPKLEYNIRLDRIIGKYMLHNIQIFI
jgi:hypothetical protein